MITFFFFKESELIKTKRKVTIKSNNEQTLTILKGCICYIYAFNIFIVSSSHCKIASQLKIAI